MRERDKWLVAANEFWLWRWQMTGGDSFDPPLLSGEAKPFVGGIIFELRYSTGYFPQFPLQNGTHQTLRPKGNEDYRGALIKFAHLTYNLLRDILGTSSSVVLELPKCI